MLYRLPTITAVATLVASLSAPAFAQSTSAPMSHDTMGHPAMSSNSSMGHHDTMSHNSVGKDSMSHDAWSSAPMSHDTMRKSQ